MDRRTVLPLVWCLAAAALFGAAAPAAKLLTVELGPLTLAGLLYLGAALVVLPSAARNPPRRLLGQPRQLLRLAGAVLSGGVIAPVLLMLALARAPAASVSLWLGLETVATGVIAWALFREHFARRTWIANGLVFAAGIMLAAPSEWRGGLAGLLAVLAAIGWGLDNNLTASLDAVTPSQITLVKGVVGGGLNLTVGLLLEGHTTTAGRVIAALAIGAIGYGASLVLYIRGAQHLGAARSQMLFAAAPFVGVVVAWTVVREPVLPIQGIAFAVMAAGLLVGMSERHGHAHVHRAMTHTHDHRHDDGHHDHVHPGMPADLRHTHEHQHEPHTHAHPHEPDLHHRHDHEA
jgi:drug/metabolite transporter (DMT)-like permease